MEQLLNIYFRWLFLPLIVKFEIYVFLSIPISLCLLQCHHSSKLSQNQTSGIWRCPVLPQLHLRPPPSSPDFTACGPSSNIACVCVRETFCIYNEAFTGEKNWRKLLRLTGLWCCAKEQQVGETASYLVTSCHRGGEFIMMPLNSHHANLLYIEGAH